MSEFSSIFNQLLLLFSKSDFYRAVHEKKAERHSRGFRCCDQLVMSLDATIIDLCLSMYDRAKFRRAKGAIKLHLLLDHDFTYRDLWSWLDTPFEIPVAEPVAVQLELKLN